ncbi:uncharacterized protein LOC141649696 [Silene latifolia]|uniref:uncharacterized protein LOC141649696 n=1 Tax=Silene latifolia TaxID=37657 RepID=UPI003D786EEB
MNKQKDIRWFLHTNNVGIFGLVETRVRSNAVNKIHQVVLSSEAQVIHAKVTFLPTGRVWWMSVIYGFNRIAERIPLWQSLKEMHSVVNGPWIAMGDFNNVLAMSERIGSEVIVAELKGFQECAAECGLLDLPAQGAFFTWNNKHEPVAMVFSRLDRVMVNDEWLMHFLETTTIFHPEGLFDHYPCTINMSNESERRVDSNISICGLNGAVFGNIETSANVAKMYLQKIQTQLHTDPRNVILQQTEKEAAASYRELEEARRSFLFQKSKAQWIEAGDENTHYFHSVLKARRMSNREVNSEEIKQALSSIPANKAPGPDGYTSQFFKDDVDIVGEDLIAVVKEFFQSGQLLTQVNSTVLTLVPKKARPILVADFRPIACCNVVYKIISKVICNRLVPILRSIVSVTQSAFIKGRDIVYNILICHDLVRLYNRKACSPRCIMKVDLKKAYDSIEWQFIKQMLRALGFTDRMVIWIMVCVSSPWFTLSLNGNTFGYF